ncbi:response regulator [Leptolyngbya sp. NK1-12]|uniref:Response regulator n=1 Tax=Leptolyngbya sp. NK1-12 TaxID=2547451 RepID=A0AA96WMT6_9CYAN|nr:response regulator [Leptolyngbya sp. NK1-12]
MKILLIEDDEALIAALTRSLSAQHYVVDAVKDGESGWLYGSTFEYDLIILDIMLPKLDGINLCQRLRAEGYTIPILLLTSQDSSTAKVEGLNAGADDYVVKPFDPAELIARIRALLRRGSANPLPILAWGDLLLNPSTCEVTYNNQPLTLTTKEYDLLELLLRHSQQVLCSDEILDRLWSSEEFPAEATVRSHIRRLRHKLAAAGAPSDFISTMHGRGYYLKGLDALPESKLPLRSQSTNSSQAEPATAANPPSTDSNQEVEQAQQQAQYAEFLNRTWLTTKPKCLSQLADLLQMVQALTSAPPLARAKFLSQAEQQQAYQVAHKLIGTLGIFGLKDTVDRARQLETLFSADLAPAQAAQAETLIVSLQQAIQNIDAIPSQPSSKQSPAQSSKSSANEKSHTASATKVMIVDDDQDWLCTLPKLLNPWGFKVTTLADVQQFWTVLRTVCPDVLVLDVNMPQFNGLELCQMLRDDPHWQRLPVVFVSVFDDAATQNQAFTVGADDYLCKPVRATDLANRILNRLRRMRAWAS